MPAKYIVVPGTVPCGSERKEDVDDALDRHPRVGAVQRGEHQVSGLGGGECSRDGLAIAHLTHQDDVRRLA